jgi:hypothetical protein
LRLLEAGKHVSNSLFQTIFKKADVGPIDVTGPSTATKGIFVIFDIFSYWPQTLQGSDILASHDGEHKYQVFMPDILEGAVAEVPW